MTQPISMLEHVMNILKGNPSDIPDLRKPLASAVSINMYPGRIVHLNSSFQWVTGVDAVAISYINFSQYQDYDVTPSGGTIAAATGDDNYWDNPDVGQSTMLHAYACAGGVEFESSEYASGSYLPNVALTATAADTTQATGGQLKAGSPFIEPICGVVTQGVGPSGYGPQSNTNRQTLKFIGVWLPTLTKAAVTTITA